METTVEVYTSEQCGYCVRQKAFMAEKGIQYINKDIDKKPAFRKEFEALGGRGIPFTVIKENGEIAAKIMGFNPVKLEAELL